LPVLNRSKLRPEVVKFLDDQLKIYQAGILESLKLKENQEFDFSSLWNRIMDLNEKFYRREKEMDELAIMLTKEEILFIARIMRFALDYIGETNQKKNPISEDVKIEAANIEDVPVEWQINSNSKKDRVLLHFHGGAWVSGSINYNRLLTIDLGLVTQMKVLSVDYRLAPEHPFPAGLEDCVKVYTWLLSNGYNAENILIGGDSAGGNLALSTLIKLRDDGVSLPAGAICLAPPTELEFTDDLLYKNMETDFQGDLGLFWVRSAYLAGADYTNPLVSPLFADLKGLPPILLQVSNIEMVYNHSTRFYERAKEADVDVTLQTFPDTLHVFQLGELPEKKEALDKIRAFAQKIFELEVLEV
jgi:acetyl esterase/lipase